MDGVTHSGHKSRQSHRDMAMDQCDLGIFSVDSLSSQMTLVVSHLWIKSNQYRLQCQFLGGGDMQIPGAH